ncbi:serine/threonine protein kinase [Plasmodium inui San Antonio 1]|uniref:non-specific serine/threonine protein kinase n=1 Tax=Plasmodium inui San Antonio 1 TaxID=1237626 RepID=W6ZZW1_9APIC|nr:serine/threonine protein kinase [Plasmodium inui San Antonio 1]EUD66472.1 serine/threonine protein kinase [Plasmodium inui San Antonio 1]
MKGIYVNKKMQHICVNKKIRQNDIPQLRKIVTSFVERYPLKRGGKIHHLNKHLYVTLVVYIVIHRNGRNLANVLTRFLNGFILKYLGSLFRVVSNNLCKRGKGTEGRTHNGVYCTHLWRSLHRREALSRSALRYVFIRAHLISTYSIVYAYVNGTVGRGLSYPRGQRTRWGRHHGEHYPVKGNLWGDNLWGDNLWGNFTQRVDARLLFYLAKYSPAPQLQEEWLEKKGKDAHFKAVVTPFDDPRRNSPPGKAETIGSSHTYTLIRPSRKRHFVLCRSFHSRVTQFINRTNGMTLKYRTGGKVMAHFLSSLQGETFKREASKKFANIVSCQFMKHPQGVPHPREGDQMAKQWNSRGGEGSNSTPLSSIQGGNTTHRRRHINKFSSVLIRAILGKHMGRQPPQLVCKKQKADYCNKCNRRIKTGDAHMRNTARRFSARRNNYTMHPVSSKEDTNQEDFYPEMELLKKCCHYQRVVLQMINRHKEVMQSRQHDEEKKNHLNYFLFTRRGDLDPIPCWKENGPTFMRRKMTLKGLNGWHINEWGASHKGLLKGVSGTTVHASLVSHFKRPTGGKLSPNEQITHLIRGNTSLITLCERAKQVVLLIEGEKFEVITKWMQTMKCFTHTYGETFLAVLHLLRPRGMGSKTPAALTVQRRRGNSTGKQHKPGGNRLGKKYPSQIGSYFSPEKLHSFVYLFLRVFTSYVYLLFHAMRKYRRDVKKRYILLKIAIINRGGTSNKRGKQNGVPIETGMKLPLATDVVITKKGEGEYYQSLFISLIWKLSSSSDVPFVPLWKNGHHVKEVKPVLVYLLETLLRIINRSHQKRGNPHLGKNKNEDCAGGANCTDRTDCTYGTNCEVNLERVAHLVEEQILCIFLKKKFFSHFEELLIHGDETGEGRPPSRCPLKWAEPIAHQILHQGRSKRIWLRKYYKMYLHFLRYIERGHIFKGEKMVPLQKRHCFSFPNGEESFREKGKATWLSHFKEKFGKIKNKFYIHMGKKYFLLFTIMCCAKRSQGATPFLTIFLKILFSLSEQKNFLLQFYFYKVRILEFILHCLGENGSGDHSDGVSPKAVDMRKQGEEQSLRIGSKSNTSGRETNKEDNHLCILSPPSGNPNSVGSRKVGKEIFVRPLALNRLQNRSPRYFIQKKSPILEEQTNELCTSLSSETRHDHQDCYVNSARRTNGKAHSSREETDSVARYGSDCPGEDKWAKVAPIGNALKNIDVSTWTILLIFSLCTSYSRKDLNCFYFNENYYGQNEHVLGRFYHHIGLARGKTFSFPKIPRKYAPLDELINAEDIPIMKVLQLHLSQQNGQKLLRRVKKFIQGNAPLQMLYNLAVVSDMKHLHFLRKINEDGNGTVHLCSHSIFPHKAFIIKLIKIQKHVNENYAFKNIFDEIKCLRTFKHVHGSICQMYQYGVKKSGHCRTFTYYILMQHYDDNLKNYINYLHEYYLLRRERIVRENVLPFGRLQGMDRNGHLLFRKEKILKKITNEMPQWKGQYREGKSTKMNLSLYYAMLRKSIRIRVTQLQHVTSVLRLFGRIVQTVMRIHRRQIIHFDINSSNILINYDRSAVSPLNGKAPFDASPRRRNGHHKKGENPLQMGNNPSSSFFAPQMSYLTHSCKKIKTTKMERRAKSGSTEENLNPMKNNTTGGINLDRMSFVPTSHCYATAVQRKHVPSMGEVPNLPSIVINDFGESKAFFSNKDFLFFRTCRGNEMMAAPELMKMGTRKEKRRGDTATDNHIFRSRTAGLATKWLSREGAHNRITANSANFKIVVPMGSSQAIIVLKKNKKSHNHVGRSDPQRLTIRKESPFRYCKQIDEMKRLLKKKLLKRRNFHRRRRDIQKSDVWLLGFLLFEMITNEALTNECNIFLYIKIDQTKDLLDKMINKKIDKNLKKIKKFFHFFFQFDVRKRKSIDEIYAHCVQLYLYYDAKLKRHSELLKWVEGTSVNNVFPGEKPHMRNEDIVFPTRGTNILRFPPQQVVVKRNGSYPLHTLESHAHLVTNSQEGNEIRASDKHNFVSYIVVKNGKYTELPLNVRYPSCASRRPFQRVQSIQNVHSVRNMQSVRNAKMLLHGLATHNVLKVGNVYLIAHMDREAKEFIDLPHFGEGPVFVFPPKMNQQLISIYNQRKRNITHIPTLYLKKKLFYKKNKHTKNEFYRHLNKLTGRGSPMWSHFCKHSKMKMYKNKMKSFAHFFFFFFMNIQVKIHQQANSTDKKKFFFFILGNEKSVYDVNSVEKIHTLELYNFANLFLFFFVCVTLKTDPVDLFFLLQTSESFSLSEMDTDLLQLLMRTFFLS